MIRMIQFFSRYTSHLFLFGLFVVLISWPVITIADSTEPFYFMLLYLFCLWLLIIVVLGLVGYSSLKEPEPAASDHQGKHA